MNSKKTIGVLIPFIDKYYQHDLWQAIINEAKRLDYNVLFFCGGVLDSPYKSENESNAMYHLPNLDVINGIISVSGTLSNYSGLEVFKEFISNFDKVPVINISLEISEANCITVDNYQSMRKMVEHIVTEHDYKKYAFISGPSTNSESNRRRQAFEDIMKEYQIPKENIITYEGDFLQESAKVAVDYFYEHEHFSPDVIICANDEMAIGVYYTLKERGIEMPEQVAFTGFDDIENINTFTPAFTTISQPLYEIGKASVCSIHDLLTNKATFINQSYVGRLVVRESCGCFSFGSKAAFNAQEMAQTQIESTQKEIDVSVKNAINNIKRNHIDEIVSLIANHNADEYKAQVICLLETLEAELDQKIPKQSFLRLYFKLNHRPSMLESQAPDWSILIQWLKEKLYKLGAHNLSDELHEIFYNAALIFGDINFRRGRKEIYDFMQLYYNTSELIMELNQVTNAEDMFNVMIPYLKEYHFNDFYVCLFDEPIIFDNKKNFGYPSEINMSLGFVNDEILPQRRFETKQMLPPYLLETSIHHEFVFFPLFFGKTNFGYIVCNVNITIKSIFRTLKDQINSTLERLMIQNKLEQYNLQLQAYNQQLTQMSIKDFLTNVFNRRGVYEYLDIVSNVENEHIESIGIIFGDIDKLKFINDQYGHGDGDFAIISVAKILEQALGEAGIVGRMGGDEFVCIIKNPNKSNYKEEFTARVKQLLEAHNKVNGSRYNLSISLGFSMWEPNGDSTLEQVLNESDSDLYKHKGEK